MTDSAETSISRTPPTGGPQSKLAALELAAEGIKNDEKVKRDEKGYPTALLHEQTTWLKKFDGEYLKLSTKRKNKEKKLWLEATLKAFCEAFPESKIGNSEEKTKAVRGFSYSVY